MCPTKASPNNYFVGLEGNAAWTLVSTRGNIRVLAITCNLEHETNKRSNSSSLNRTFFLYMVFQFVINRRFWGGRSQCPCVFPKSLLIMVRSLFAPERLLSLVGFGDILTPGSFIINSYYRDKLFDHDPRGISLSSHLTNSFLSFLWYNGIKYSILWGHNISHDEYSNTLVYK